LAERYFGQIQTWCHEHHVASSGHILWEEALLHHIPLYGNALAMLERMDIPGLDLLTSDPKAVLGSGWMTATLPASAAMFNGGRQMMTEVSDLVEIMGGKGEAALPAMQATAAWQAALGVTEFTLYYRTMNRLIKDLMPHTPLVNGSKAGVYFAYVGRLNAILREAQPAPDTLLYYPIYDLWGEYRPVGSVLVPETQTARARKLIDSFNGAGRRLLSSQVSFAIADHVLLSGAEVKDGGLWIKGRRFDAIVLPASAELPEPASAAVDRFRKAGGCVMRDGEKDAPVDTNRLEKIRPCGHIEPACDEVIVGRFVRDRREIVLVVNVAGRAYSGAARTTGAGPWQLADPATGAIRQGEAPRAGSTAISIPAQAAMFLIGPATPPSN
jgi:hypothetical protein